jgi:ankyrin repeat protein
MDRESYLFCRTLWDAAQAGAMARVVDILAAAKTGAYGDKVRAPTRFPVWRRGVDAAMRVAACNDFVELVPVFRDALASAGYGLGDAWKEPLWLAAHTGSYAFVSALLQLKVSPDATASQESTLLEAAVDCGHVSTATVLLEAGADVNLVRPAAGTAPLHRAACTANVELIQLLLQFKARVNCRMVVPVRERRAGADVRDAYVGATPLCFAARRDGDVVCVVELLLAHKADVDLACGNGSTPAKVAAVKGNVAVLRALVRAKAGLDRVSTKGVAPVYAAANNGRCGALQVLADAKANLDCQSAGRTPLCVAVEHRNVPAMRVLLDARAQVDLPCTSGTTPLCVAVENGDEQLARLLVDAKAHVDYLGTDRTPLCKAVLARHDRIVRLLVAANASVNAYDRLSGMTLTCLAAMRGAADVLSVLIEAKADVDAPRLHSTPPIVATPVLEAALRDQVPALELLLAAKAEVDKGVTYDGTTALWEAVVRGHAPTVRALVWAKADMHRAPVRGALAGVPPLFAAASRGRRDMVRLLLDANVDPASGLASDGTSPLWTAAMRGHGTTVRMLLDAKAPVDQALMRGSFAHATPPFAAVDHGHRVVCRLPLEAKADLHLGGGAPPAAAVSRGDVLLVQELLVAKADVEGARGVRAAAELGRGFIVGMGNSGHPAADSLQSSVPDVAACRCEH